MKKNRQSTRNIVPCGHWLSYAQIGSRERNFRGDLDNFVGVHPVMNAYFSGRMPSDALRIERTYGEETDMEGAYQVEARYD